MAEGSFSQDKFSCPVCLDLLKDPVTIPCGHSYCMSCITDCWNREDQTGVYSCPQCRHTFTSRPALCKNVMFAELVEHLKKTKLQTTAPVYCYAGPLDVECDVCTGRKYKAVKSCLECLNSYCQNHLEQHEKLFQGKKHDLMDPNGQLNDMICPKHNKRNIIIHFKILPLLLFSFSPSDYRQFTMDSNTVNKRLRLFDGNRSATNTDTVQQYSDHPDGFDFRAQVLCKESVNGRCYWEVEWSGDEGVLLSASYRTIKQKGHGKECTFGWNDQSWSLFCAPFRCLSLHKRNWTDHPVSSSSSRIGVYVDHRAGTLSFYSVSDTMTLIHRVQTTFTQPLYPGFTVNKGSTVKVCNLTK
ncbi:putative tripartite motif-containing protein 16-like [Triplophysa rosa]|uniref:Tripartite motif-containing protein 16-like n=1 Tax=Triplophysa rosa TaxID=992332 RepID=A0A9W7WY15_TRIRA|nr:putative tripartite motif-containing protein 16-like [Triplophysa rosa]